VLRLILRLTEFENGKPIKIPEFWDDISLISAIPPDPYAFDYYAAYQFLSSYIRLTNDTDFLLEKVYAKGKNLTVAEYLDELAHNFLAFNNTPQGLTDYGGNIRTFLEVIPTFIHAVPCLNYGNAAMLFSMSDLASAHPGLVSPKDRESKAKKILESATKYTYNKDGTFNSIYPNGSAINVRSIADFVYIAQQTCILNPKRGCVLEDGIMRSMADFAWSELYVPEASWCRALSLKDQLYSPDNLLIFRADWGIGGSYPGLDGMFVEALAVLDGNYSRATELFRACEKVTHRGALAQGIAVYTPEALYQGSVMAVTTDNNNNLPPPEAPYSPAWPEYFQDGSVWPETLRDIANVAGSFPEAMIRTLFGWNPAWDSFERGAKPEDSLMNKERGRPWEAKLIDLKTPFGHLSLEANSNGVSVSKD